MKGTLRGFDELGNLILGDTVEFLKDEEGTDTRKLGLIFARGPNVSLI